LGIVDSADGVTFTSTEASGSSNAVINWEVGSDSSSFRSTGTIAFCYRADRTEHVFGWVWGENYGWNQFRNGQGPISANSSRIANAEGPEDDQASIAWHSWHNNVWYGHAGTVLEYDTWYRVGFSWGGATNDFEVWVDGALAASDDLPGGASLPWGRSSPPSGWNVGLGDFHERGYNVYASPAGVTYSDMSIWDEYVAQGDTAGGCAQAVPTPTPTPLPGVSGLGLGVMAGLLVGAFSWAYLKSRRRWLRTSK
jgi:hypothetical protein